MGRSTYYTLECTELQFCWLTFSHNIKRNSIDLLLQSSHVVKVPYKHFQATYLQAEFKLVKHFPKGESGLVSFSFSRDSLFVREGKSECQNDSLSAAFLF